MRVFSFQILNAEIDISIVKSLALRTIELQLVMKKNPMV